MSIGVKKVNEAIMAEGRTLIITEEDPSKINWSKVQDGTLKIDPVTGEMSIKIKGEADWVPAKIAKDGSITIAKDAVILYEVFEIKSPDNGDGYFTYINEAGEQRTKQLTEEGYQVFELEKGSYVMQRNKIEAFINDVLHRSVTSGGLIELDEERVILTTPGDTGTKITFKYFQKVNVGNPYPRFFIGDTEPENKEFGDFWIDTSEELL